MADASPPSFHHRTTLHIDPGKLDAFWEAFTPIFEQTSTAPQCLYSEVLEEPAVPGKIIWLLNWESGSSSSSSSPIDRTLSAIEPFSTAPPSTTTWTREPGFVSGKRSNFTPQLGANNTGTAFHVWVTLKPDRVQGFRDEMRKIYPFVAGEPECLYFEVFSSPSARHELHWVENWTGDVAWMQRVQLAKAYYKPYLAATEGMIDKDRSFVLGKRREGMVKGRERNFWGSGVWDYVGGG